MAVTNITAGQKDWLSVLNNDLSQIGDKVASTSYPVTFVNGYSGDVKCQILEVRQHSTNGFNRIYQSARSNPG